MEREIENFFIDYNKHAGKRFTPVKFGGAKNALMPIKKGMGSGK